MPDHGLMLNQILTVPDKKHRTGGDFKRFENRVVEEIKKVHWTATMPKLVEKVAELLEIPLPGVMIAAWEKGDEIMKTLDDSRKSPEEVFSVELADHTLSTEFHPQIEIQVSNFPATFLNFVVKLSLELKGIELKIRKGKVLQIRTGSCQAGGELLYGDMVLAERKLSSFELPGVIDLQEA
jgi:hypothetical protein